MEFLKLKQTFAFMSYRKIAVIFTMILVLGSIASLMTRGINWGIDFTGSTLIQA